MHPINAEPPEPPAGQAGTEVGDTILPAPREPGDVIVDEATTEVPVVSSETDPLTADAEPGTEVVATPPAADTATETVEAVPAPDEAVAETASEAETVTETEPAAVEEAAELAAEPTPELGDTEVPIAEEQAAAEADAEESITPEQAAEESAAGGLTAEAPAVEEPAVAESAPETVAVTNVAVAEEPATADEDADPILVEAQEAVAEAEAAITDAQTAVAEAEAALAEVAVDTAQLEPVLAATPVAEAAAEAQLAPDAGLAKAVALLRPGDVSEAAIAVWSPDAVEQLRTEWRAVQDLFIDDPAAAVAKAHELVSKAVHSLADTLVSKLGLDPAQGADNPDTEAMRVAMRQYRDFLNRVLAL